MYRPGQTATLMPPEWVPMTMGSSTQQLAEYSFGATVHLGETTAQGGASQKGLYLPGYATRGHSGFSKPGGLRRASAFYLLLVICRHTGIGSHGMCQLTYLA